MSDNETRLARLKEALSKLTESQRIIISYLTAGRLRDGVEIEDEHEELASLEEGSEAEKSEYIKEEYLPDIGAE